MATAKTAADNAAMSAALTLPEGAVPAFTRVEMQPGVRIDDGTCVVAMLTGKPLDRITELAYTLGLPKHGPTWIYSDLIRRLLANFDLVASEEKVATSADAFEGAVCMFLADYNEATAIGRWVLWHHMKGEDWVANLVYDPAYWLEAKHHVTRDYRHLLPEKQGTEIHYMTVSPKAASKGKAK